MVHFAAAYLAAALALPVPSHRRRTRPAAKKLTASRLAREIEFGFLAARHAMLRDFLVETGSERPMFQDPHVVAAGEGINIGPTIIDVDFLGNPIVRARVRNRTDRAADVLLSVSITGLHNTHADASTFLSALRPGEMRSVELFCPAVLSPKSVSWKVTPLL